MWYLLFLIKSSCIMFFLGLFQPQPRMTVWELLYLWNYFCILPCTQSGHSTVNGLVIIQDSIQVTLLCSFLWSRYIETILLSDNLQKSFIYITCEAYIPYSITIILIHVLSLHDIRSQKAYSSPWPLKSALFWHV